MGGISFFRSPHGHLQRGRLLDGGPAAAAAVAAASPATAGASTVAALGVPRPAGVDSCSGPGLFLVLGVVVALGLDVGAPGLAQSQFGVVRTLFRNLAPVLVKWGIKALNSLFSLTMESDRTLES